MDDPTGGTSFQRIQHVLNTLKTFPTGTMIFLAAHAAPARAVLDFLRETISAWTTCNDVAFLVKSDQIGLTHGSFGRESMKGQKKLAQRNGSPTTRIAILEKRCRALSKACERLRVENEHLKQERDGYRKAVVALMVEPFEFDKKALLAHVDKQQPLEDLLAELEAHTS